MNNLPKTVEDLVGLVPINVAQCKDHDDGDMIRFTFLGMEAQLYHIQECCENVWVEDICGDLEDLVGVPILMATETTGEGPGDSEWTFYNFSTVKGDVTIRFNGESHYYSLAVTFGAWKITDDAS